MRLIFMGTPDFAVPCLQSLIEAGHDICMVFTQPDKPKGRGYALTPPPVKILAQKNDIPVMQPKTLRDPEVIQMIKDRNPECIVVVAYGKLLPKEVLETPLFGCVNVHASLLPKYRGAAPIQWSVINGDRYTGVTTMFMAEGLDTGDMLLSEKTEIGPEESAAELHDRLSILGSKLIVETLRQLAAGTVKRVPQGETDTAYASMLTKDMARIDWNRSAQEIHNLVRGLSAWPVAYTTCMGKQLKIHKAKVGLESSDEPGKISIQKESFIVACGGHTSLELEEVQYEGGKRMSGKNFLCGHNGVLGASLG